ncbi:MAG: transglutaminase family protein [Burkholderiales bacterium]|nr:transglutaminase family protein [Burkholderiales bacterium]MDQ3194861.1 transglutaminase family protein [Pseudomonadota bacterium]
MLLQIEHSLHYRYSEPVYLEPYIARLAPRNDAGQVAKSFELQVEPQPQHLSLNVDLDGTLSHCLHFRGVHDRLSLTTRAVVETLRGNPFDFLLHDAAFGRLPPAYPARLRAALQNYLLRAMGDGKTDDEIAALSREVALDHRDSTFDFLTGLTRVIHRTCQTEYRASGAPRSAAETLALASGTCRDLAVLWMDACRAVGLAARFVSGYMLDVSDDEKRKDAKRRRKRTTENATQYLHAWAEVYLPGGGWRGFDPSTGLAVADRHVALAASADPALAAPGQGAFLGTATSELKTAVAVMRIA